MSIYYIYLVKLFTLKDLYNFIGQLACEIETGIILQLFIFLNEIIVSSFKVISCLTSQCINFCIRIFIQEIFCFLDYLCIICTTKSSISTNHNQKFLIS